MTVLIPGGENKITNPSAEVNTTGWSAIVNSGGGSGASFARDTADSWVGDASFRFLQGTSATNGGRAYSETVIADVDGGEAYTFSARYRNTQSVCVPQLEIVWYDGANGTGTILDTDTVQIAFGVFNNSDMKNIISLNATAPSGAVSAKARIGYINTSSAGGTVWFDGVMFNEGDFGPYIDGDQGDLYYWTGTDHASVSRRRAEESDERRGDGGSMVATPLLWLGDKDNNRGREISAHILAGQIDMRNDRDVKLTFSGEIDNPDLIDPYVDYLIPVLRIQYPDGHISNRQLGIYSIEPMPETAYETHRTGRFEARDLTWNLLQSQFEERKSFAAGLNIVDEIRTMLEDEGFTRHAITDSSETFAKKTTFKSTDNKLFIINSLLDMIGYYTLYMDMDGYLKSNPYQYFSNAEPTLRLFSGEGSVITGAIEKRKNPERICNFIRVIKEDTRTPANSFDYTYINDNPSSPVSTVTLQRTIVKEIKNNNIANISVAETMAKREAERAASIVVNAEITTLPVPDRSIFEIYECDIDMDDGTGILNGLVRVDGWSMGFTPQSLLVKHFVNKLEAW